MRRRIEASLVIALAVLTGPVAAQDGTSTNESPAPTCADRPRLETERAGIKAEITKIAMSGTDRRDRKRGVEAGKMAAGTAAGLLLPFGIGLALKGTTMLAEAADKQAKAKHPAPPPPPGPDVPALIERQHQLDLDIAGLADSGCPAPPPAERSKRG